MKITLNQNPLHAVVELDEREIAALRQKLIIADLEDRLAEASFRLTDGKYFNLELARKSTKLSFLDEDGATGEHAQEIDRRLKYYVEALTEVHGGDCTCIPASCMKCHAEEMLGIDTAPYSKHTGNSIQSAFSKPGTTLDEAIEVLRTPIEPQKGYEQHLARWNVQRAQALIALLEHQKMLSVT